jgi:predicted TIM-barrel fold metal-dependent hydrolase
VWISAGALGRGTNLAGPGYGRYHAGKPAELDEIAGWRDALAASTEFAACAQTAPIVPWSRIDSRQFEEPAMIVDTHPHLLADDTKTYPIVPLGGVQSEWSKGQHLTAEEFLALMDDAGVEKATLVQAATVHGVDNRFCVEAAQRYPDRFVAVVTIDILAPDAADTLSYWVEKQGARGLRIFASGTTVKQPDLIADPQVAPVWERARALGIPVCLQTHANGLAYVRTVLERYPDVKMTLDHLGGPSFEGGPPYTAAQSLFDLAVYPNLYLKFSSNTLMNARKPPSTPQAFLRALIDHFGADRIMWGSNFPNVQSDSPAGRYKGLVDLARADLASFSEEEQDWLLGRAALSLYPWLISAP